MNMGIQTRPVGALRTAGFTIVETMIVLVVTGALFVAIAATLAGRQGSAEFTHAIQTIQSQIQQNIDQVSVGFYPSQSNFTCVYSGTGLQISSGSNAQGTNQDCVFLGKVMQFGMQNTDPEEYQVYTIAGWRQATVGSGSPFASAHATVLGYTGSYASFSTAQQLEYGVKVKWVRSYSNAGCAASPCSIGAVAVLMEPGSLASSGTSTYNSIAQPVDLIPIADSQLGQSVEQAVAPIENATTGIGGLNDSSLQKGVSINPTQGVQICFVSATSNESGLITIGGSGRQLSVTLNIKSNTSCS